MLLLFVRLCNSFVNEPYSCSIDALARLFSLNQAGLWLCARAVGWFYLAVHRRSGRYPFAALQRRGLLCDEVRVCAMFTYNLSQ